MSKEQYLKIINKELQKVNKKIDVKIVKGEQYFREAREHKMLLRKARQFNGQGFFSRIFGGLFSSQFSFR
ncbi:MAG: hypothetical protein NTZ44_02345 [Candidatus Nomurabacteria bacterium]|nr:hypothetical protein [Candidatus Nomurabacteria bacterium]